MNTAITEVRMTVANWNCWEENQLTISVCGALQWSVRMRTVIVTGERRELVVLTAS